MLKDITKNQITLKIPCKKEIHGGGFGRGY